MTNRWMTLPKHGNLIPGLVSVRLAEGLRIQQISGLTRLRLKVQVLRYQSRHAWLPRDRVGLRSQVREDFCLYFDSINWRIFSD